MPIPPTGNFTIMEAVATMVTAVVVIGGAVVGVRYGRKALNLTVGATAYRHDRYKTPFMLVVRPTISRAGVLPVRLEQVAVVVRVFEVLRADTGGLESGEYYPGNESLFMGASIRGSETKGTVESFTLPDRPNLVGWQAVFAVTYKGESWAARTYEPVPQKKAETPSE